MTRSGRLDTWDVTAPQCMLCKHRPPNVLFACAAFPGLIPEEIRRNDHDHRQPWIDPDTGQPGDEGIALAGSILFEPKDDAAPEALERLYADLRRPGRRRGV
jgi:hypothetical protein